jgi:hypothetical protein
MPTAPHSPAPWTAHGTRVSASDGVEVADVCPQPDGQIFEANRHLIAAAPDMLEALKLADGFFSSITQGLAPAAVKFAIDKAEGR